MKYFLISALLSICFAAQAQQIDTSNSWVEFSITKMNKHEVVGTIGGMLGEVEFKEGDLHQIDICINSATVKTDNKLRDKNLRKEKYFDVDNHPTICFVSDSIVRSESGWLAHGTLRMLGVERTETFALKRTEIGLEGSTVINGMDYGLGSEPLFKIGEEVTIRVYCSIFQ